MSKEKPEFSRRKRGFEAAGRLVQPHIRSATATRGFAESRLLTDWVEIAGAEIAAICRPVEISYRGKGGFGATLVVLTTGAHAPILQAELPKLKERVNRCYGYDAISRIRITQTAPTGFAEGRPDFTYRKAAPSAPDEPSAEVKRLARDHTREIADEGLAAALERLCQNVLSKARSN